LRPDSIIHVKVIQRSWNVSQHRGRVNAESPSEAHGDLRSVFISMNLSE